MQTIRPNSHANMKLTCYSKLASRERIDGGAGVIYGVSVITTGDAAGHDMVVDETTLSEIISCANTHPDGIKVKFGQDHKAGAVDIVGCLKNFRKQGNQVKADLHLLKSADEFQKILEMAQSIPNEFGLSAVFSGEHEEKDDEVLARCKEIYSIDLVSDPAANPNGLFSTKSKSMPIDLKKLSKILKLPDTATDEEILAAFEKAQPDDEAPEDKVKYSEDGKSHSKACMCKECKMSKKKMSEILTPEFVTELKKLFPDNTSELATRLKSIEDGQAKTTELARKQAVDALVAEASRDGKVIPLTDKQLAKLELDEIKEVISKCKPAMVALKRGFQQSPIKINDTVISNRKTPEGREAVKAFCRQKQEENVVLLGSEIKQSMRPTGVEN